MSARENGGIRNQTAAGDRGISPQFVEGKKNTEYRNPTFSSSVFFTNNSSMDNGAKSARYNNRDSGLAQQRIVLDAGKVTEGAAGVVRGSRTPQRTVTASRHNPIVTQADVRDNNVSSRIVDSIEHRDYSNVTKRVQDTSVDHKQGGADIHTTYWKEDEDRRKELQNRSRIIKEQAEAAKTEKEEEKVRNKMQQIAYKQQLDDQLSDRKTHRQASVKKEQVLPSRVVLGEREVENRPEVLAVKRQQFVNDLERQVEEKYEQKRKVEEKEKGKVRFNY